ELLTGQSPFYPRMSSLQGWVLSNHKNPFQVVHHFQVYKIAIFFPADSTWVHRSFCLPAIPLQSNLAYSIQNPAKSSHRRMMLDATSHLIISARSVLDRFVLL